MTADDDIYNPPGSKDQYRKQLARRKHHPLRRKVLDALRGDWYLPERIVVEAMGALAAALAAHERGDDASAKQGLEAIGYSLAELNLCMPLLCHYAMRAESYETGAMVKRREDARESRTRVLRVARRLQSNGVAERQLVTAACSQIKNLGKRRVRQILQEEGLLKKRAG
jgi:hypothetical protein